MKIKELSTFKRVEDWFDPDVMYAAKNMLPRNQKLYYIDPVDFLSLSMTVKNVDRSNEKLDNLKEVIKNKIKIKRLPLLRLSYNIEVDDHLNKKVNKTTALVIGHDGRHRNLTLKGLGFNKVPVIVIFQDMNSIPEYVINQDKNKKVKFSKIFKPYK